MVVYRGKTKIAQYGQWDGYPAGQGRTVLEFLRSVNLDEFKKKVAKLKWLTKKQGEAIDADPNWDKHYPYLSRDAGAEVLNAVMYGKMHVNDYPNKKKEINVTVIGLVNRDGFAGDSLFCEWAYVIDLDNEVLEVYDGFNKKPLTEADRFRDLSKDNDYYPIKLVKSYPLSDLPTLDQMIKDCDPPENEEE